MKESKPFLGLSWWLILCAILCSNITYAQQYNFRQISASEGLPQLQVNAIWQDSVGYLWLGTPSGLSRYDGEHFRTWQNNDGLVHNSVRAITGFGHKILIGTERGLSEYNRRDFRTLPFRNKARRVFAFHTDQKSVLIATDIGLHRFDGDSVAQVMTGVALDTLAITAITRTSDGRLWAGSKKNGLWYCDESNLQSGWQHIEPDEGLTSDAIRALLEDQQGQLWVGTSGGGVFVHDGAGFQPIRFPGYITGNYVTSLAQDAKGKIWIGLWGSGLLRYDGFVFTHFTSKNGLGDDVVASMYVDQADNLWAGTFTEGLALYLGDEFMLFGEEEGVAAANVRGVASDAAGDIWVSTLGGVVRYSGTLSNPFPGIEKLDGVRCGPLVTNGDDVVVGTYAGDLYRISKDGVERVPDPENKLRSEVLALQEADDGSVMIGTFSGQILKLKDGQFEVLTGTEALAGRQIWCLFQDSEGAWWIGTDQGVYHYVNGKAELFYERNTNVSEDRVTGILQQSEYLFFITSNNGLWRYHTEKEKFSYLKKEHGLSGNQLISGAWISEDEMLLTSVHGADRVKFLLDTIFVEQYGLQGLPMRGEFTPCAIEIEETGQAWLGTSEGLLLYQPTPGGTPPIVPRINLEAFRLFNTEVDWVSREVDVDLVSGLPIKPKLNYDENHVTFAFAGLQYASSSELHYRYRLIGLSDVWSPAGHGREAIYTNLEPGEYTFEVMAANHSNEWSDAVRYSFTIVPPFWQTWWFYVCFLLVASLFLYLASRSFKAYRLEFFRTPGYNGYLQKSGRLLLLIGFVVYPVVGLLLWSAEPQIEIQLWEYGVISLVFGVLFLGSYFQPAVRRQLPFLSRLMLYALSFHGLYQLSFNSLDPALSALVLAVLGISSIVYHRLQSLTIFALFVLVGSIGLVLFTSQPRWSPVVFVTLEVMVLMLSFTMLLIRLNLSHRLVLSDKIVNSSGSIIIASDSEGKIIHISPNVREILGYSEDELLGEGWWKMRSTEDPGGKERIIKKLSESRGELGSRKFRNYETPVRTKDGNIRWIQWEDNVLSSGMIVGIGQDVTENHKLNQELKKLSMVASKTDNYVVITDEKSRIEWVNEGFVAMFGYQLEDLKGKRPMDVMLGPDSDSDLVEKLNDAVFIKGDPFDTELLLYTADGKPVWTSNSITPVKDAKGQVLSYFAVGSDVTEKVESRAKLQDYTHMIEQKNKDITDSINYAERIQRSIIPSDDQVREVLPDSFVLFQPRDQLSGDFYWVEEREGCRFVAVVDCTGHSVPGALISLIGYTLLNQALFEHELTDPSDILRFLDKGVKDAFMQPGQRNQITDGMDISLCVIDKKNETLQFAGAMISLFLVRNEELQTFKANRLSIGYSMLPFATDFETQTVQLQAGDTLYMATDGYSDQFGGEHFKKFGLNRMYDDFPEIADLPMSEQKKRLGARFEDWKGTHEQTDDVTVLGFRI